MGLNEDTGDEGLQGLSRLLPKVGSHSTSPYSSHPVASRQDWIHIYLTSLEQPHHHTTHLAQCTQVILQIPSKNCLSQEAFLGTPPYHPLPVPCDHPIFSSWLIITI